MANEHDLELIRERTNIVDLIGVHTRLKKTGSRYKGLCPFHTDSAPSFTVDPDKKLWHCFGCGAGGDVFTFVMQTDNVDFAEAVQILAKRTGVMLSEYRPGDAAHRRVKDRILELNELAAKYFGKVLTQTKPGEKFMQYLEERRIPKEEIRSFKLGASLEAWDGILKALIKKDFTQAEIIQAGLAVSGDNKCYDRFRNRLMFPLFNVVGDIVGFAGRAYGDAMPKYLNTPENPVFEKGKMLYALDRAKKNVGKYGIILTEGYMDVISLHKVGIKSAVASMGTALTPMQVELLRRYCDRVVLSYDSDIAGDKASMRGIELLIGQGMDIRVVSLPKGEDPDSITREGGAEAFNKYLDGAGDYFDFFLGKCIERIGADTPVKKRDVILEMAPLIEKTPNDILKEQQKKKLAERLEILEQHVNSAIAQVKDAGKFHRSVDTAAIEKILSGGAKVEMILLKRIMKSAAEAERILKVLDPADFEDQANRAFVAYCRKYYEKQGSFVPEEFLKAMHPQEITKLAGTALFIDDQNEKSDDIIKKFIADARTRHRADLIRQLEQAQKKGDTKLAAQLASRVAELKGISHRKD
jgi:DNA primase